MLSSLLAVSLTLTALTTASTSLPSHRRTQVGTHYLRSSVTAHRGVSGWANNRQVKRQDAIGLENQWTGTLYTIDIEIGTPPQNITVLLDTGSGELWVNPTCDTSGQTDFCESFSRFDYTQSSTIKAEGQVAFLGYGIGNVSIEYVSDVVGIGSATITNQIFGIGLESYDMATGILGLAPCLEGDDEAAYSYVLDSMVTQGLIDSRAFSLDLRDVDSPDGSVIFGGIDTGKYVGSLEKCPIIDIADNPGKDDRYWIYLTALGITLPSGESGLLYDGEQPVFLDSGNTVSQLPTNMFESIGAAFPGAEYDSDQGYFIVDCSTVNETGTLDFGFNDKVISVSFKDFIWQAGEDDCVLGVLANDDEPVLGDSFLRAAYVVYDQDNRNLHLAQAANCGSNLIAISSGEDAVPSATGDCTASATTPALTGTLTVTQAPSTITDDPSYMTPAAEPGPEVTQTEARVSSSLCLTCKSTATGTASSTSTTVKANAAARETGSHIVAVGAFALAAWLV